MNRDSVGTPGGDTSAETPVVRWAEGVAEIQRLLKAGYDHYFATSDGHCKSSEGIVALHWPTYFEFSEGRNEPSVSVYSYVLGPHRMHDFKNIDEALAAVRGWVADQLSACPKCEARDSDRQDDHEMRGCEACLPSQFAETSEASEAPHE